MDKNLLNLKNIIEEKVFLSKKNAKIANDTGREIDWVFDFRKILFDVEILNQISNLFLEKLKDLPKFQIGGLETASIPIITSVILNSNKNISGFYVRKSREKNDLQNMTEGNLTGEPIVLVDDLMNRSLGFIRQIEVLESLGKKVIAVCTILRFRDISYYKYLNDKGIKIFSLFTLEDFKDTLGTSLLENKIKESPDFPFKINWQVKIPNPAYLYVVPKSAPIIDESFIYFGSDSGNFWALNQETGKEVWRFKILGFGANGKTIFSSPTLYKEFVYFGAYDGNFYALNKETGKKKWIFMEADWIGSSPAIAEDLGLIYVGLEFGFWKKRGGIVALNAETGKKKWECKFDGLTHSSPAYYKKNKFVVIGSNDGGVYCFKAKTGEMIWKFQTGGEVKASFDFDEKKELVTFGSHDGKLYILKVKTGEVVHTYDTGMVIYSSPLIYDNKVFFASLNKFIYCIDLNNFELIWKFETQGRIFASPIAIDGKIYIGSNDARLYEIEPQTGKNTGIFQSVERIVNKIAYNEKTKRFFVPTFANEIYCLSKTVKDVDI
ncbi:MAG: PQQ-binding-like beta-propeller repeat protein [Patescibacteria group bacterium]